MILTNPPKRNSKVPMLSGNIRVQMISGMPLCTLYDQLHTFLLAGSAPAIWQFCRMGKVFQTQRSPCDSLNRTLQQQDSETKPAGKALVVLYAVSSSDVALVHTPVAMHASLLKPTDMSAPCPCQVA